MMTDLTVGYLREFIKDLPDDMQITECDYDEANLSCTTEQIIRDAQFLMFVSNKCYEQWGDCNFEGIDKPIPKGWR